MESVVQVTNTAFVINRKLCIFCQKKRRKLRSTRYGCERIRLAARKRDDTFMLTRLMNFSANEYFFYHLTDACYRLYVNKRNVERCMLKKRIECIKENRESEDSGVSSVSINSNSCEIPDVQCITHDTETSEEIQESSEERTETSEKIQANINKPLCMICNKLSHNKVKKMHKIHDKKRAEQFLCLTQKSVNDVTKRTAYLKTPEDVLENDVYFHETCLRNFEYKYNCKINEQTTQNDSCLDDDCFIPQAASSPIPKVTKLKQTAIQEVIALIICRIRCGECFSLSDVCSQVNILLETNNLSVKNADIKKYLELHYPTEIKFTIPPQPRKSALIYHSTLTVDQLLNIIRSQDHIKKSAQTLRECLKEIDFEIENKFCDENDLKHSWNGMKIPAPIVSFFSELFNFNERQYLNSTSEKHDANENESQHLSEISVLKIKSLFQMMYYIMHKGHKQTPLHVMTGLAVHNVCKSSALIKSLNRIGVSISYDEVQRIRSKLASYIVESSKETVPLPAHFQRDKFTIAAFDNFDHNEATDSGLNSTHDTVSVLFQDDSNCRNRKPNVSETEVDKRSRCFDQDLPCQRIQNFYKPADKITLLKENFSELNTLHITEQNYKNVSKSDLIWNLCRMNISNPSQINSAKQVQETPSWAAYNSLFSNNTRPTQIVGFLPILPFPVTQYSTVYTAMCNFKSIHKQLDQKTLPLFCDEGVYHIARHIKLVKNEEFENIVVMLGGFHMIKIVLACIGKYLKGSGVEHLFIETEAFGVNVVDQVLNGTNYARSIKGFFMLAEVLQRLQIEVFFKENKYENYENELSMLQTFQELLTEKCTDESQLIFKDLDTNFSKFHTDFTEFVDNRTNTSELFKYWNNVLRMIQLVKDLIKADRSGDWDLHVESVKKIQPLFQIMDRSNYARWSSIYLSDILTMEQKYPELNKEFKSGRFTFNRSKTPFTSVAPDQGLEQTINRSKKSTSGIIGSTRKKIFVAAWDIVYHEILAISNYYRECTFVNNDNYEIRVHHDFSKNKIDAQETLIQNMIKYIKDHVNPFENERQRLRNIITEELVAEQAKESLLNIFKTGCDIFNKFWIERIIEQSKTICSTISKINLPSFKSRNDTSDAKKSIKNEFKEHKISQRIIDLARERNFSLEHLMTYELTKDNCLFESDDILKKEKNKSSLVHEIEKLVDFSDYAIFPNVTNFTLIVDVMIVCRKIVWKNLKCFKDFGNAFCNSIKNIPNFATGRIDFIFDSYFEISQKSGERERRYNSDAIDMHRIDEDVEMPRQDQQFWASTNNKILLQDFLRRFIQSKHETLWPSVEIIYSNANDAKCNSSSSSMDLEELQTEDIEEADLRIIVHVAHAVKQKYETIVVLSPDTDVLVLLLYYWRFYEKDGLKELWNLRFNTAGKKNILPVHIIAPKLGLNLCALLPAIHHLTGSDYTSKVGTKRAGLQANPEKYLTDFAQAVYNWRGDTRYGLPLEIGETLQILEECAGWYRGFSIKNRAVKGIFPSSYVHLKSCKIENEGLFESVIPLEDPVVREVTLVLREWGGIWKRLYVDRETYKFNTLRKVMCELLEWRRQLLAGTLTTDQTRELKLQIINKVDWGNRKLGLDLVPRQGSHMVDPDSMSVIELYHVHVQSAENSQGASARGTLRRKEHKKVLTHHLYFCMRDFGHSVGEDAEIYFSLYDAKRGQYISERFLVRISKEGFSNYVEKMHSNCTIFTDLGNADLTRDLYMVAHVMRCGRMLYSDSGKNKAGAATYRRPHGVGVLSLLDATQEQTEELELTFKVFQGDEKEFHQLHEQIIRKDKCSPLPGQPNYGIVVSFRVLHGELCQVRDDNPLLFKNICLTKKLGFSDVIMPGDVRNDLYLKLERGEFERGGKSTGKNIEVTIMVLDAEGEPLEGCLFGAAGTDGSSEYQSLVIYHHNSPSWAETLRLAVPIDKFYGSHVRFEFRHCSTREKNDKKLFAFAFVRLMEAGGATLQDGQHELYIYKCEERAKLESLSYLAMPSNAREPNYPGIGPFTRSPKEAVFIQTLLCSTKLTQNVDLLSLLQWKAHPEKISEALGRVLRLDGEELVKFLQDILDALFAMFHTEDGNSTAHSGLVFQVLVSIFILLEDSKFEHFKPVINAYISGHFAAALVYKGLISSVQHCTEWVTAPEKQEFIMKCFRSLEYIFKFIIQSRLLYARATAGQYEDSFRKDIFCVFAALNKMMTLPYEMVLSLQVALLISIPAVFEQLIDVLSIMEVTTLTCSMLDSVPRDSAPQLIQAKLEAIKSLVTSELFKDDESRNMLLATICRNLRIHLARREELRTCTEILGEILSFMYKRGRDGKVNNCVHHDVETLCLSILDVLIQTILIIINAGGSVLNCLVACLMGLLQLLDEYHYGRLWEELTLGGERKPLKDFLLRVFFVLRELVRQEIFPPDWLVLRMQANNIILKSLQELAQPLAFRFLHGSFDSQLWSTYFNLAVAYLTQPSLQLEHFSEVKREKIVEKYGDMRVLMGFQILSMWSHLGEKKLEFIPGMVGPFLEVTLVPESELRKATLHIFFDMMECEQHSRGSFKSVESELIDKLDILISENKGDDEYRQLFNTILLDRVQSEDPTWKDSGTAFITSVTRLLERLLDYRSVIQGDENRDKRMSCTVNLLNFYKNEFNRKEMYLRYIYKLHDLHLAAENYTEAGFTMKLYADQLGWSSTLLAADHNHPQQPEWQRKELLYHKIIHYFDRGKCWEKGIPLCKELAVLYETRLYDYAKLSDVLKVQAKFLDNILTQLRPEPEYFRVGFYGLSFPLFVRNKLFIYRGLEYERIGAFTQRLQTEFPSAQILMKNSPPDETILSSEGQYIQICNVKPIPEEGSLGCGQFEVPERVVAFYLVNDVRRFVFDRPLHRGQVDRENEFKSLWIERTTLTTEAKLPGILRWFEVIEKRSELLAPVQYACETMQSVERELRRLVAQYTAEPHRNINPFSMRLQGIIDANVMGGITKYQEAFLTTEFARQNPEMVPHVNRLKNLILDQMSVLEAGLLLHGQIAPSGVQPLHKRLIERFTQLKQSLGPMTRQRLVHQDSIINSPLPPVPVNDKQRPATLESMTGSRMSRADSDGHLEDEGFYTKVDGCPNGGAPPPIPQREVRPRSVGYGTTPPRPTHQRSLSKPLSPKLPLRNSLSTPTDGSEQANMRSSWSEPGSEPAPPLPPRGCTPDKRDMSSSLIAPPAPPKRLSHKRNTEWNSEDDPRNSCDSHDLRDSGISTLSSLSDFQSHLSNLNNLSYEDFEPRVRCNDIMNISPPSVISSMNVSTVSFTSVTFQNSLLSQEASPPPIPPKAHQDTPSAPSTLERASNRTHNSSSIGHADNYSVPKFQSLSVASDGDSTV